jgi:hypothetical protein
MSKTPTSTSQKDQSGGWTRHEHVAPAVANQARHLVEQSGSPELAKQAIDAASQPPPAAASDKDAFARRHGFMSYLEMFEASTVIHPADGKNWCVTALPAGKWALWNEQDLRIHSIHLSFDEARNSAPQSGSSE